MSEIKVRPAIFAPQPLRRRAAPRGPAPWRGLTLFAAGAALGGLAAFALLRVPGVAQPSPALLRRSLSAEIR